MDNNLVPNLRAAAERWRKEHPIVGVGEMRYDTALEDAAKAIEVVQEDLADAQFLLSERPELEWIHRSEQLPPTMRDRDPEHGWSDDFLPSDDVLVWLDMDRRQRVAWYSHRYKKWYTVDEGAVYAETAVTYWMPALPAPKEE